MEAETTPADTARRDIQATRAVAMRLVLAYSVLAGVWIMVSDNVLAWLFKDPAELVLASTMKGWLFVGVTSLLLFGFLRARLNQAFEASMRELAAQTEKARALQLLATIADNSSDAIFAKDLDGRYLLCNREAARVMGRPAEQALGCDDSVFLPPAQAGMIRANDLRVIAENRINTYEEAISTVDGERTYLTIKGPLRDGEGLVIGMFGIARDITERQQAEDALRENIDELERFNRVAVGREMEMIGLKQQVNELSRQLGREPPFTLPMLDAGAPPQGNAAR